MRRNRGGAIYSNGVWREASDAPPLAATSETLRFDGRVVDAFAPETVAASIVIPCRNSGAHVPALLRSLLAARESVPFETIFVSDGDGPLSVPGKQVVLVDNGGFARACNAGARHAAGQYLVLLNADTRVTPRWLRPMIELLESAGDIVAVGNRQLGPDGRIKSIGSEWSYRTNCFEHVRRGAPDDNHPEARNVTERDMMTGACLCLRRDTWRELGGLDEEYRIGYWEDSDLCLRLREAGGRILYCPDSVVCHDEGHSGAARHPFYARNAERFRRRWVHTGMVDKFARRRGRRVHEGDVVACYIVLNEEEYVAASIESVYPLADRIIVVEGGNDFAVAAGWCGADKRSTDGTVAAIRSVADPDGKIELLRGAWRTKADQRQAYAQRLRPGDWMLLVDGDEVFDDEGLWRLSFLMHHYDVILPGYWSFWNDFNTIAVGVWDAVEQVKTVRWHEGYRYADHLCPADGEGRPVTDSGARVLRTRERLFHHYSWVKPVEKLRRKADYYTRQTGRVRANYIDEVFLRWRREPGQVERTLGTHPFGGGGARSFNGRHPEPIRRRLERGELGGEGW